MAGFPMLLTAALALVAAVAFAHVAVRLRQAYGNDTSRTEPLILLLVAATLVPTGLREVAQWAAAADPAWQMLEVALFQALHVPAALSMVLLMHLTARRLSGSHRIALLAGFVYLLIVGTGVGFLYGAGHMGLDPSAWDAVGSPDHELLVNMVLAFFAMPALLASGLLILGVQRDSGADAERVRRLSLALTVFYMGFAMDAIGATGLVLVWPRLMTLCAAGLAYLACVRPPRHLRAASGELDVAPR